MEIPGFHPSLLMERLWHLTLKQLILSLMMRTVAIRTYLFTTATTRLSIWFLSLSRQRVNRNRASGIHMLRICLQTELLSHTFPEIISTFK